MRVQGVVVLMVIERFDDLQSSWHSIFTVCAASSAVRS